MITLLDRPGLSTRDLFPNQPCRTLPAVGAVWRWVVARLVFAFLRVLCLKTTSTCLREGFPTTGRRYTPVVYDLELSQVKETSSRASICANAIQTKGQCSAVLLPNPSLSTSPSSSHPRRNRHCRKGRQSSRRIQKLRPHHTPLRTSRRIAQRPQIVAPGRKLKQRRRISHAPSHVVNAIRAVPDAAQEHLRVAFAARL